MAAIVNVCVDPRLNHDVIRAQVRLRLEQMRLPQVHIFITNDAGGNIGSALRETALLLHDHLHEDIVLAALLHHDDCNAATAGMRKPLATTRQEAATFLSRLDVHCPVVTGTVRTEDGLITWTDRPAPVYEVSTFRMPRMFG